MTDDELSKAVADRLGPDWRPCYRDGSCWIYMPKNRYFDGFARSHDACFAPGGPVEYMHTHGLDLSLYVMAGWTDAEAIASKGCGAEITKGNAHSETAARAICLVFLAAVKATS